MGDVRKARKVRMSKAIWPADDVAGTSAWTVFTFRALSLQLFEKVVLKVIVAKICNGKIRGLATLV